MTKNSQARERVLEAADRLFYAYGIGAVGVDRISHEAGVGKMTLYRHFASKEALIRAYLTRRNYYWRDQFSRAINGDSDHPRERIARLFERLGAWFASSDFYGCAFINADAERVDRGTAALISEHKIMMRALIQAPVNELDVADPASLAEQIFVLTEGAIVTARLTGSKAPAETARTAVLTLIDTATGDECVNGVRVP